MYLEKAKKHILTNVSKAVGILTIITIISKFLGLFREIGIAAAFGAGMETDAFYVAVLIPTLIFTSVGLALQNLFMIEFTKVKEQTNSLKDQSLLISKMVNILLVTAILLFVISFLFADALVKIIAPGFVDPDKVSLTVVLTRILLPVIIIIPIYNIKASVMKVYNRFGTIGMIDLIFNVAQLTYLLLFADRFGIHGLAYAILGAYLLQLIIVEILMYRLGFRHYFCFGFKDDAIKRIFGLFLPTLLAFAIIQVNAMVEKMIASTLPEGSISALNYALTVRNLVFNVFVLSVLTVIYPKLLHHRTNHEEEEYQDTSIKTLKFLIVGIIPMVMTIMLFSNTIIKVIFERGEFLLEATLVTGQALFYYAIGILFFSLKEFFVKISFVNQDTRLPLFITFIGALLHISLSLLLLPSMGINGIALGLSISELISLIVLVIFIGKNGYLALGDNSGDVFKIVLITFIVGIPAYFVQPYLNVTGGFIIQALAVLAGFVVIVVSFVLLALLFRVDLFKSIFKRGERKS